MRILSRGEEPTRLLNERQAEEHRPELQTVTFLDLNGAAHSVHVHKDGPFTDPKDAMAAFYSGEIHADPNAPDDAEAEGEHRPEGAI